MRVNVCLFVDHCVQQGGRGPSHHHGSRPHGYSAYDDDEYDVDGFVVDDDEEEEWRRELRGVTGYDPRR